MVSSMPLLSLWHVLIETSILLAVCNNYNLKLLAHYSAAPPFYYCAIIENFIGSDGSHARTAAARSLTGRRTAVS